MYTIRNPRRIDIGITRGDPISRRLLLKLSAAGAAVLSLPKAGWSQETPAKGGVLRVAASNNPSSLDPQTGRSGFDHPILFALFDTLVEFDFETLLPLPGIAREWVNETPVRLVLTLNEGVRFHDGTPCDAAAVKFNLDRAVGYERSNVKSDSASIESVDVIDPLHVAINLKHPDSALILVLSDRLGMMISPSATEAAGGAVDRTPVGTGAWKFASWTDNSEIILTRNEDYWRPERPYLDGIEFKIIPEMNTGLRSVVAGENDLAFGLTQQQLKVVERADTIGFIAGPTQIVNMLYFNLGRPTIGNVKVRQALNYAVNREAFNAVTQDGEIAYTLIPSSHWAYSPAVAEVYPYDPDKARALLAEAGYADGFDLAGVGWNDQKAVQRQEILIEQFGQVGIRTKFVTASVADSTNMFMADKIGDVYLGAFTGRPDPSQGYHRLFDKDAFLNPAHADPAVGRAEYQLETQSTSDITERIAAFHKLEMSVAEAALFCPLTFSADITAFARRVKGVRGNLTGKLKFDSVFLSA
ncbi:MAG TPA: ABC transporter substrate-binding protein [Rhodopila sp.]